MNLRIFGCLLLLSISSASVAQIFNATTNSDWNTASNWAPTSVPSGTGTDVTIANSVNVAGGSFTIGDVSVDNNTGITVASGGTLTLGSSTLYNPPGATTKTNLTFTNSGTLNVAGTLYIYGDLIVNNSLTLTITGTMIVYGDIVMANGGDLAVTGSGQLQVSGNISGGANTHITTTGSTSSPAIAVGGTISLGGGNSNITGPGGSITTGGGCACAGNGSGCSGGTCGSTVLPVKLQYFEVLVKDNVVELKWATTMEEDFSTFIVQRSGGGLEFQDIGEVAGQGKNIYDVLSKYSFEDKAPLLGYNYYRLKALDIDNTYEYFGVEAVRLEGKKGLTVYPNPSAGNAITFSTNFSPSEGDRIKLLNTFGKELLIQAVTANNVIIKPNETLSPGVYFLQYLGTDHKETMRIIVQK